MKFTRKKSALVPGTTYSGTVYSVTIWEEDTPNEKVLINITSTAGNPGPASYATGAPLKEGEEQNTGSRLLNRLLDSVNCNDPEELVGKEVNFRVKPNEAGYLNTIIYPRINNQIAEVAESEEEEPAI